MTRCIDGVCYMTPQFQWTTLFIALFVVCMVGLGIWSIVRDIVARDRVVRLNEEIEAEAHYWSGGRDPHAERSSLMHVEFHPAPVKEQQLISPKGLRWLERKLGL